ncbi:MAG TPA: PEP-CTERM sorting domain-containing protein [Aquabacterium sp.]|uniref:PEP-CTERM sorting domain-containing protein n=1 Tax=Aquabacterium sp. TaxID=1872578 RepID=UPI002E30907B|nr:PEP-CTERM sorting domain-containing protein [Aquabacterium sp.]HEX5373757.1 PEP-CTERM sorting domain-containing protein [Aquabacterium sp.]
MAAATLVCAASGAHAQFNYLSQSRSISAVANANGVELEPIYSYYPYNPYDPQSGGQYISGYIPRSVGNTDSQSLQAEADNFGDFGGTVQAHAIYEDSSVTSTATASSSLQSDRISLQVSAELAHQNQRSHPFSYSDLAGASMDITFRLDATTTLVLERTTNLVIPEPNVGIMHTSFAYVSHAADSPLWFSADEGNALTLAAGEYTLTLTDRLVRYDERGTGTLASSVVVRAVPEASTWAMMGLGLVGVALGARRRRPATLGAA